MTVLQPRPDGRHQRSTRTRAAILAAHWGLIVEGQFSPTTSRIAEAAGVSPRTFFSHFPDLETLFVATTDAVYEEILSRRRWVEVCLPLGARTDEFLAWRVDLYVFLTPFSLATRWREQKSAVLRERRMTIAVASLDDVATTFAPELDQFPVGQRAGVVATLETCTTWSTWYHLAEELGLGSAAARQAIHRLVLQVLEVRA